MRSAKEYKKEALQSIKENWVLALLSCAFSLLPIQIPLLTYQIDDCVTSESSSFLLELYRQINNYKKRRKINYKKLYVSLKYSFKILLTILLVSFYVFIFYFVFLISGIIKRYSYSMTGFVAVDNSKLRYNAAIDKSVEIMKGYKRKLFLIDLTFSGWFILSLCTFGFGLIPLGIYINATHAAFYKDLKAERLLALNHKSEGNN